MTPGLTRLAGLYAPCRARGMLREGDWIPVRKHDAGHPATRKLTLLAWVTLVLPRRRPRR